MANFTPRVPQPSVIALKAGERSLESGANSMGGGEEGKIKIK
jgi:hypothetical protein